MIELTASLLLGKTIALALTMPSTLKRKDFQKEHFASCRNPRRTVKKSMLV